MEHKALAPSDYGRFRQHRVIYNPQKLSCGVLTLKGFSLRRARAIPDASLTHICARCYLPVSHVSDIYFQTARTRA
jgi:hypothetical protein